MPAYARDGVADAGLANVALANQLLVCSGASVPADRAAALSAALASVALTPGLGNGDFTAANGDTSGRKVTVAQQADVAITATGTAAHIVLIDDTEIVIATECASQPITSGGTVTVPAFDHEIADVTLEA